MKFALISSWHVHTKKFMNMLSEKDAECLYIWDFDHERGQEAARLYGGVFEPDYRKILADQEVEAVVIEAPTTMHKELIVLAAQAKKHIFSDKALALSTQECLEIEQAVTEHGVKFMLSLESLAINSYQYALEWVKQGNIGQVTMASFRRSHGAVIRKNLPDYWFDPAQSGGGVTLDLGCHGFSILPLFCGEPKSVQCLMTAGFGSGVDERSTTIIEFESGCIGTAMTSFVGPTLDNYLEVIGTQGSIQVVGNEHELQAIFVQSNLDERYHQKTQIDAAEISKVNPFPIVEFVDLLASDQQSLPQYDLVAAKRLTRLIECAYQSAETGQKITY
jgi:Predicted dehydrogenases and related proteins